MRDTKVHHLINNDTKQDSLGILESKLSTNMMSIVLLKTVYLGPLWTLYNRIQSNNYMDTFLRHHWLRIYGVVVVNNYVDTVSA